MAVYKESTRNGQKIDGGKLNQINKAEKSTKDLGNSSYSPKHKKGGLNIDIKGGGGQGELPGMGTVSMSTS